MSKPRERSKGSQQQMTNESFSEEVTYPMSQILKLDEISEDTEDIDSHYPARLPLAKIDETKEHYVNVQQSPEIVEDRP